MSESCTCSKCVNCCKGQPGWFAPGEAEKAAALMGLTFEEFKSKFLIEEYWIGGAVVLAPRKVGVDEGRSRASWGAAFNDGRCVFLTPEDRCAIHEAKPMECRETFGCKDQPEGELKMRDKIQRQWAAIGSPLGTE